MARTSSAVALLVVAVCAVGLSARSAFLVDAEPPSPTPDDATAAVIQKQCSKCHVPPLPEYLPRSFWRLRIQEMAQRSLMGTGVSPGEESTLWQIDLGPLVRWFEARSPERLTLPEPWPEAKDQRFKFVRRTWNPPNAAPVPVISNTRFFDIDGDGRLEIVACDMGHGLVFIGDPDAKQGELREIARIPNPAQASMADLDGDGLRDLLIADLGDFLPGDHEKGSIVWLRQTAPGVFEKRVLVEKLARAAHVSAADMDGDGDLDLLVAAFGWHVVGSTFIYENQTTDWKNPVFVPFTIDARPGPIHVLPFDLNQDGRMDFVDLVSQQFEHVVAYVNRGKNKGFRAETIFRAPVPVWGSSGIDLVDLDMNGRMDLLMTNGDSLDDFTVRPFHGIRWFEGGNEFPWKQHDLAIMPGAHRAQAADMDGDGDLDVVACAFLPHAEHPEFSQPGAKGDTSPFASLGILEQVKPRVFERRPLEVGRLTHTSLDLGDFDGDGDVDIVTGNFVGFTFTKTDTGFKSEAWVEVWENLSKSSTSTSSH
jgi:hypothetical protein